MDSENLEQFRAWWKATTKINPELKTGVLLNVHIGMTVAALIIVSLRLWVRTSIVRALGADDYWIMAASVLALVSTTIICMVARGNVGVHLQDFILGPKFEEILKYSFASNVLYMPLIQMIKISVLSFYLRLSPDRHFRFACFTVMGICSSLAVTWVFVHLFQCDPIPKAWAFYLPGKCINIVEFIRVTGIINIILNFVLFGLPIMVLKSLQIPPKQKAVLWILLSVEIIVCVISIARITMYFGDQWAMGISDPTFWVVNTLNWSCVEYCSALICASLPPLKPLLTVLFPCIFGNGKDARGLSLGARRRGFSRAGKQDNVYSLDFVPGVTGHNTIIEFRGGKHTKPLHGPALPTEIEQFIWGDGVMTVTKTIKIESENTTHSKAVNWADMSGIMVQKEFKVEEEVDDQDDQQMSKDYGKRSSH